MRAAVSLALGAILLAGCVLPESERTMLPQDAPIAKSFVERDGTRLPLYDLAQVRPWHLVRPEYPRESKEKKQSGEAIVRVLVAVDGRIADIEVRKSNPSVTIGESARKAVSQWHFPRIVKDGIPISYFVDVPVIFAAEGTPIL